MSSLSFSGLARIFVSLFFYLLLSTSPVQAFSLLEWFGISSETAEPEKNDATPSDNWAKPNNIDEPDVSIPKSSAKADIQFEELKTLVTASSEENRKKLLADPEYFANFIRGVAGDESLLTAARANNLDKDPLVQLLMEKASENALRQVYLQRLMANKIPADFPSEEQINSFYEDNKDKFVLQERVYLWQIFLPIQTVGDSELEKKIKSQATEIKKKIDSGELDFAVAAVENSAHLESRKTGGYMGVVQVSTILPEIKESVLKLKPGVISEPLRSSNGYHLIRRGEVLAEENLQLDKVKEQIRKLLKEQAAQQLRTAIFQRAAETYPVDLSEQKIEEWRLKLRTNL